MHQPSPSVWRCINKASPIARPPRRLDLQNWTRIETLSPGSAGILPAGLGKTRLAGRDAGAPRAGLPRRSPEGEGGFMGSLHFQFWTRLGTLNQRRLTGHWSLVTGN